MAMKIDYNPIVDAINSRLKRATKLQNCNFKPGKKMSFFKRQIQIFL